MTVTTARSSVLGRWLLGCGRGLRLEAPSSGLFGAVPHTGS